MNGLLNLLRITFMFTSNIRNITYTKENFRNTKLSKIVFCFLIVTVFISCSSKRHVTSVPSHFTFVVMPDTQKLSSDEEFGNPDQPDLLANRMKAMAQWIADKKDSLNIVMVAHLGDMTEDQNVPIQWQRNVDAWRIITDAGIPFAPCQGNHDSISSINKYFPISDYATKPYWGGSMNDGIENAYYLFEAGGMEFILVVVEEGSIRKKGTNSTVREWASSVFAKYPERRGILTAHNITRNGGEQKDIIEPNDNVFMSCNGHDCGNNGNDYWTTTSTGGNTQHLIRSDYQCRGDRSGGAMFRYYVFKPKENKVYAYTYDMISEAYHTDAEHQFSFTYKMKSK